MSELVRSNFKYPDIKPGHFKFGSSTLAGEILRANGDWRDYLPPEEDQNVRGVESSACFVEAQQHTIATLEEESFAEVNNNYAARFNALLAGGTESGGDPLGAADSFRHDGLVPDSAMPFVNIGSWEEFHSWKGVVESSIRALGKRYLMNKSLGFDIVCEKSEPVATKYLKLKQALQYSPCPVSVYGWYEVDGVYTKPDGVSDNHLVELVYIDDQNCPYIRDTYAPYTKKLAPFYNFDFGMRWTVVKKNTAEQLGYLAQLLSDILQWIKVQQSKVSGIMGI